MKFRQIEYTDHSGNTFKADELLHCPFCGCEPSLLFKGNNYTKTRSVTIRCTNCRVQRTDGGIRHNHEQVAKISIKSWNKRSAPILKPLIEDQFIHLKSGTMDMITAHYWHYSVFNYESSPYGTKVVGKKAVYVPLIGVDENNWHSIKEQANHLL